MNPHLPMFSYTIHIGIHIHSSLNFLSPPMVLFENAHTIFHLWCWVLITNVLPKLGERSAVKVKSFLSSSLLDTICYIYLGLTKSYIFYLDKFNSNNFIIKGVLPNRVGTHWGSDVALHLRVLINQEHITERRCKYSCFEGLF